MRTEPDTSRHASSSQRPFKGCFWSDIRVEGQEPNHCLRLSVSFGRGRYELLGGSIDFGLSEVELRAEVEGGRVPLELRWPRRPLEEATKVKRKQTDEHIESQTASRSASSGIEKNSLKAEVVGAGENSQADKQHKTDEFDISINCIISFGPPNSPTWRFERLPGHDYLAGTLSSQAIGGLKIDDGANSAVVSADWDILRRSVRLIDSDGLLASLVQKNSKLAVIRALIRKVILNKLMVECQIVTMEISDHD